MNTFNSGINSGINSGSGYRYCTEDSQNWSSFDIGCDSISGNYKLHSNKDGEWLMNTRITEIQTALERLNSLLPLKQRQNELPRRLKALHQFILRSLAADGSIPEARELDPWGDSASLSVTLQTLAEKDLIVCDPSGNSVVGAYPVTLENTPHKVTINNHCINAMCALDAVSIAPLFEQEVAIHSVCHLSHAPLYIQQKDMNIIEAQPSQDIVVGIRWQQPRGYAAHSMCTEMVFLKDRSAAEQWQQQQKNGEQQAITLLTLREAIELGAAFFIPLLD